jgi:UPF0755 protein
VSRTPGPRPRRPAGLRWGRRLGLSALVVGLVAGAAWAAWSYETRWPKISQGAPPVRLVIPEGASGETIARELQAAGLVRHPLVFRVLARTRGVSGKLKAGEYALSGPLSLEGILDVLVRGDVVRREVTVPEGRSLDEIATIVASEGMGLEPFLVAAHDPSPVRDLDPLASDLEGYLFPDTYEVPQSPEAPRGLVHRMTLRFRQVIEPQLPRIAERGLTVRQVVTLASIVELETAQPVERPRIAAVFLNRLERGMPLQTDPSIVYALKKAGRWDGDIRKPDLDIDSPYNTYRRAGLPPGPLGSPGRESILAVIDPAPTKDLYFVSRNDGTHEFSETLEAHNRAVDRYQKHRAAS